MKNFLLVCNFKANIVDKNLYQKAMGKAEYANVILCPNFCDIRIFSELKTNNNVLLGGQDVSQFDGGSFTGEVTAKMLKNAGADFCIVGHSERKKNNFETLYQINNKIKNLIEYGVTPIVCVGEDRHREKDKQTDFAIRFVLGELNQILDGIDISQIIIAYEPIWAIGTGDVPTNEHIFAVASAIKKYTGAEFVLYGGSFNQNNFENIAKISCIDGALIGGASLNPEVICGIQKKIKEIL